jgi:hypothetical protein
MNIELSNTVERLATALQQYDDDLAPGQLEARGGSQAGDL